MSINKQQGRAIKQAPIHLLSKTPFRCMLLVLAAFAAIGCSENTPSSVSSDGFAEVDTQAQQIGSDLGVDQPKPAHNINGGRFAIKVNNLEYADDGLLVKVQGSVQLYESQEIARHQWVQLAGPRVDILAPSELSTDVILPQVTEQADVTLALQVADSEGYVAQRQTLIRLLPQDNQNFGQLTYLHQDDTRIRLSVANLFGETITFRTEDGTAVAGRDYVSQSGELSSDAETQTVNIDIPLLPESSAPGNRYLIVHLWGNEGIYRRLTIALYGETADSSSSAIVSSSSSSSNSISLPSSSTSSVSSSSVGKPQLPCSEQPEGVNQFDCQIFQTDASPYLRADFYLDPDYVVKITEAQTAIEGQSDLIAAMEVVKQQPTAIWIDRFEMLYQGDEATERRSLYDHLQRATALQMASGEPYPMAVQVVLASLPDWDAAAEQIDDIYLEGGLELYQNQLIEPLTNMLQEFPNLRIIIVPEPNTLPKSLNVCDPKYAAQCSQLRNVTQQHLTNLLLSLAEKTPNNTYVYLPIGHSAWLTMSASSNINALLDKLPESVAKILSGFATNTAAYVPTEEYLLLNHLSSPLFSDRRYIDELSQIDDIYSLLTDSTLKEQLGFIIDTSRNGWGGPNRPRVAGGAATSRLDRRTNRAHWCNLADAGIGERLTTQPDTTRPYLHAFTWLKQPGYSDGDDVSIVYPEDENADPIIPACSPENGAALANPPPGGHWFQEHFLALLNQAWPPLIEKQAPFFADFQNLTFELGENYSTGIGEVNIVGEVAPGADISSVEVFINRQLISNEGVNILMEGSKAYLPVAELPIALAMDTTEAGTVAQQEVFEVEIQATDTQGVITQGIVMVTTAPNGRFMGTETSDLVLYDHTNSNGSFRSFGGNNLFIPRGENSRLGQITTGKGDDRVLLQSGTVYGEEGNDTIEFVPSSIACNCWAQGGLGDDIYLYRLIGNVQNSVTIEEDVTDEEGVDTLRFTQYNASDVVVSVSSGRTNDAKNLVLNINQGGLVVVRNYFTGADQPNNTIEKIEFADGEIWTFDEVSQYLVNE